MNTNQQPENNYDLLIANIEPSAKRPEVRIPISIVRSSLFSVSESEDRHVRKKIAAEKGVLGIDITYTGPSLNQDHFKIWQAIIHLAKLNGAMNGEPFVVPASEILRLTGKTYRDHQQRKNMWEMLVGLAEANVNLSTKRTHYVGSLIFSASKDKETGQVALRLNPELVSLLSDETLENDMLRVVHFGRDQIAIWMHNYLASWGSFRNVAIKELHTMCGTNLSLRHFRYRLKAVMEKLATPVADEALGIESFIESYYFKNDILHVQKKKTKVRLLSHEARVESGLEREEKVSAAVQAARSRRAKVAL